jgi:Helix-turn-helix domain
LRSGTPLDPYLGIKALAAYSGCSVRWLRDQLTAGLHPLPCYRLPGGKILVRRSEFDAWLARYRHVGSPNVARVVDDVLAGLR